MNTTWLILPQCTLQTSQLVNFVYSKSRKERPESLEVAGILDSFKQNFLSLSAEIWNYHLVMPHMQAIDDEKNTPVVHFVTWDTTT